MTASLPCLLACPRRAPLEFKEPTRTCLTQTGASRSFISNATFYEDVEQSKQSSDSRASRAEQPEQAEQAEEAEQAEQGGQAEQAEQKERAEQPEQAEEAEEAEEGGKLCPSEVVRKRSKTKHP